LKRWRRREDKVRKELEDSVEWVLEREVEIKVEAERLEIARGEWEKRVKTVGTGKRVTIFVPWNHSQGAEFICSRPQNPT
jgi:hypothetical protein